MPALRAVLAVAAFHLQGCALSCVMFEPGPMGVTTTWEPEAVDEFRDEDGAITDEGCVVFCDEALGDNYANLDCSEGDALEDGTVEVHCSAKTTCPAAVDANT